MTIKGAALARKAAAILTALLLIPIAAACDDSDWNWPQDIDPAAIAADIGDADLHGYTIATEPTDTFAVVMAPSSVLPEGGAFVIEMYSDYAPRTVKHISTLVGAGFYNGLKFHRVSHGFVIQAGSPFGDGTGGSGKTIKGEFADNGVKNELKHKTYVVSMGRLTGSDAAAYDSADSQFFICLADNAAKLDGMYAAFGKVIAGTEVVDALGRAETAGTANRPIEDLVMTRVFFVEKPAG